ncbi:uncharacterized protein I303_101392 [Kwoniella dejecticola CBS 10117]|uniref:Uncharacterized protein n=1 Tax=Kwoniella dejecticola CBS 10117 TaxID=1296121 RepID=A0A1A6AHT2_9TREE|nr:uncharacterized protein I303_01401 [Kwoniella dejecticola CBS 10117]OBR89573.1 hypothetical protein I303_01401 [Kwoniella dejecticola CBS 10117]
MSSEIDLSQGNYSGVAIKPNLRLRYRVESQALFDTLPSMSFFPPIVSPNDSFSQHASIQPPLHPCTGDHAAPPPPLSGPTMMLQDEGDSGEPNPLPCMPPPGPCPRPPHLDDPPLLPQQSDSRPCIPPYRPCPPRRPCVPPHCPCPGPIPPYDDHYGEDANPYMSHSAQQGLPLLSSYNQQNNQPPPGYATPSPPLYKPLPSPSEGTLLLAPPPSFTASTCPYLQSASASGSTDLPTHTCHHCGAHTHSDGAPQNGMDWVIALLIVLNFFVWGAVAYGYWCEFSGTGETGDWSKWITACEGGQGALGWGRICSGEECHRAFVDC